MGAFELMFYFCLDRKATVANLAALSSGKGHVKELVNVQPYL